MPRFEIKVSTRESDWAGDSATLWGVGRTEPAGAMDSTPDTPENLLALESMSGGPENLTALDSISDTPKYLASLDSGLDTPELKSFGSSQEAPES